VLERLPPRLRTPAAARAITSPSAVLLGGAAASAAILGGLPLLGAAAVGAVAYGARVALGLPRRRREDRIDPFSLREPWRGFVREALRAQTRFQKAVRGTDPGPLRDRLAEVGERVAVGVRECWRVARRGAALDAAVGEMDIAGTRQQLAQVEAESRGGPGRTDLEAAAQALRRQVESGERLGEVAASTRDRLRRLDAQLHEAVARAVELSLRVEDVGDIRPIGSDVEAVVAEMESLRQALDETGGAAAAASS
jgi:hypothetical protein